MKPLRNMAHETVLLIGREGESTSILHNALASRFTVRVAYEEPPSRWRLIRSRIRRMGLAPVLGQIAFQVCIAVPLGVLSAARRKEILAGSGVSSVKPPASSVSWIHSVNGKDCLELVRMISPDLIVINGTRILSRDTLSALSMPVLNTHVGITPGYRGVHGAYWALANNDPEHCGVTVHLVDAGIDTGTILHQALIHPTAKDNITTYPTMQMTVGSQLLCQAVAEVLEGRHKELPAPSGNARWNHPTLLEYVRNLIRTGVR